MHGNRSSHTKIGFTLVELSIVIVIVGLLIGGILVGQSLIESAKINKVVRQYQQYDAAISTFRTKYKQYPGDSNLFSVAGNNDKSIGYAETANAWRHLSLGVGLKNKYGSDYQTFTWNLPTTEYQCPVFDLEQDKTQTICLGIGNATTNPASAIYYRYHSGPMFSAPIRAPMQPKDALAIDTKLDNGIANTGSVTNAYWGTQGANTCNSGGTYLVNNNSFGCAPWVLTGSVIGDSNK